MSTGALVGAAVILVGLLVALDRFALRVVQPGHRLPESTVPDSGLDHEDFTIHSDGFDLGAWYLPAGADPTEPLIVLLHGWGASYGTVLGLGGKLVEAGHDLMLFDVRGHGRSPRAPFVTIRHFRDDVRAAVAHARERFPGRPLVFVGHSMGGSAGVLAVADGADVDALAIIAAPADVLELTSDLFRARGLPGDFMVRLLTPFWWPRIGTSFRHLTPHRRISEIDVPILVVQPENDRRVPRDHADRLAGSAGVDLHVVPDRAHTDVLDADQTFGLVRDFVRSVGARSASA